MILSVIKLLRNYFPNPFCHQVLDTIRHIKPQRRAVEIANFINSELITTIGSNAISEDLVNQLTACIVGQKNKLDAHSHLSKVLDLNKGKIRAIVEIFFLIDEYISQQEILYKQKQAYHFQRSCLIKKKGPSKETEELRDKIDKINSQQKNLSIQQKTQAT